MKNFAISLIALAAVSTASFAGDSRNYDIRDSDTYIGNYNTSVTARKTIVKPFAAKKFRTSSGLTLQELTRRAQEERDRN
jgi:hypothetical protein